MFRYVSTWLLPLLLVSQASFAQADSPWAEDIDFLFNELEIRHADLYHTLPKDSLEILVDELKSNLDAYSDNEMIFELGRVLVGINDGHTGIFFPYADGLKMHRLPLLLRALENSIVVMNAMPEYENLIGLKLTEIENKKVDELLPELYKYIPRDNKYGPQGDGGDYLAIAELLEHLGVQPEDRLFVCTFEGKPGKTIRQKLEITTAEEFEQFEKPDDRFDSLLWLKTKGQKFWKERIEPDLLYVQLNSSDIGELEEEMEIFSDEIVSTASHNSVKKVVLDLRENHGGSVRRTNPLLQAFITLDQLHPEKKLFVLISKNTFSAAGVLAARLEYLTDAIFVGSPIAWRPNSVGDIGWVTLPNHQIRVRHSRLFIRSSDEWNASPTVFPDFEAPIRYKHIINGIDPGMEVVKTYRPKKDFSEIAQQYLSPPDLDQLIKLYYDYKANRYNEFEFRVHVLNGLGIKLYHSRHIEAALKLFELNVQEYPWSPRAHNNLGEVLLEMGEEQRGMYHLKKAFTLHKGYTKWRELVTQ